MNSEQKGIPLNVLLADDDSDDCLFFANALKELPIATHLTTVHNGEELMDYLSENSAHLPDILFLDLSMPRKTGFECLSEIHENEKLKGIPVVVFTISYPHNPEFERQIKDSLSNMGAQNYISKGPDVTKLKKAIHHSLILLTKEKPTTEPIEKL
jgi:CheY-like chemotaxis protein